MAGFYFRVLKRAGRVSEVESNLDFDPVYVIGFPKSGNTWLTRLLADALQAPVWSGVMRGSKELASEINSSLVPAEGASYKIAKVHWLPEVFFREIDDSPTYIVYLYRDFRDVVISAFFYWNKCKEASVRKKGKVELLSKPHLLPVYLRNRRKLRRYVELFCVHGIAGEAETSISTWSQHIDAWQHAIPEETERIFVSYEQLLHSTHSTLATILDELSLRKPSDKQIKSAVRRQSFDALKKHFRNLPDDAEIPFGKTFNQKFLRKGASGDWKNFLSREMGEIIQRYHGAMLWELGYESDPHWYRAL